MKISIATVTAYAISLALIGCSQSAQQQSATPAVAAHAATQGVASHSPSLLTNVSQVEANRLVMYASDPRIKNWDGIGTRQSGHLISNGTNGYLMYGPKVPFDAGKYQVKVYADELKIAPGNSIKFDVTSNNGKQVYATLKLNETTAFTHGDPIATFDFELPAAVLDLEVRAFVTSGSTVELSRYEVSPAPVSSTQ